MGTQISSEVSKNAPNELKKQVLSEVIHPNGTELQLPYSSYEGIISQESIETTKNDSSFSPNGSRLITSSMSQDLDDPPKKVPTKFSWRGEGKTVYVTGNFANWKQWFLMNKSNKDSQEFTLTLDLPRGTYEYKFVVDKIWKYSKDMPQIRDEQGNINNIINNSEIYGERKEVKEMKSNPRDKSQYKQLDVDISRQYVQHIPKKCELNCEAPLIPGNYQKPFNFNTQTRQNLIGNKQFLTKNKRNHSYTDSSYKIIARASHVNLNLLVSDIKTNKKSGILHIATTTRVKEKYVTYVYYKPVN